MNSTINRFIELFTEAFAGLSVDISAHTIEDLATLVDQSMTEGRRRYHRPPHIFDLAVGLSPHATLAALFHDVVYWQLDDGFPVRAESLLLPILRYENERFVLRKPEVEDPLLAMCIALFGFEAEGELKLLGGMNEFLSAIVAVKLLQAHLSLPDLLTVAACIEATVPFRGPLADGTDIFDARAQRLAVVNDLWKAGMSAADLQKAMTDAVILANRDVASFSESDPGRFLAATWLLIEESNAPLKEADIYSIRDYRGALVRMEGFLRSLDADHVFHRYSDTPSASELAALRTATRSNLTFGCHYLGIKILGVAIVEALALATGGDCPISLFLGELHAEDGITPHVEDFLPPREAARAEPAGADLLRVLEQGRAWESDADLNHSPISAFVYRSLGFDQSQKALADARRLFAGDCTPLAFLRVVDAMDPRPVPALITACAQIATSRADDLEALLRDLRG